MWTAEDQAQWKAMGSSFLRCSWHRGPSSKFWASRMTRLLRSFRASDSRHTTYLHATPAALETARHRQLEGPVALALCRVTQQFGHLPALRLSDSRRLQDHTCRSSAGCPDCQAHSLAALIGTVTSQSPVERQAGQEEGRSPVILGGLCRLREGDAWASGGVVRETNALGSGRHQQLLLERHGSARHIDGLPHKAACSQPGPQQPLAKHALLYGGSEMVPQVRRQLPVPAVCRAHYIAALL